METRLGTIYKITNKNNGKVYIGFDSAWPTRMTQHIQNYNKESVHFEKILYRAFRKHGIEAFEFDVIYQSRDTFHCLNVMESFFIEKYNSFTGHTNHNGYNATLGGNGSLGSSRPKSTEWCQRQSTFMSECNPATGRMYSDEEILHRSKKTREYFQKNPEKKLTGNLNPMYGKTHSDTVKQRISETSKLRFESIRGKILGPVQCSFCIRTLTPANLNRHERVCDHNPDKVSKRTGREPIMCTTCNCQVSPYKYRKHHRHGESANEI